MAYPRINPDDQIMERKLYSMHCNTNVPYAYLSTFEVVADEIVKKIKEEYPQLSRMQIARVIAYGLVPKNIDYVYNFKEAPGLTHRQFLDWINAIGAQWKWNTILNEVILLEGKSLWWLWLLLGGGGLTAIIALARRK